MRFSANAELARSSLTLLEFWGGRREECKFRIRGLTSNDVLRAMQVMFARTVAFFAGPRVFGPGDPGPWPGREDVEIAAL